MDRYFLKQAAAMLQIFMYYFACAHSEPIFTFLMYSEIIWQKNIF